MRFPSNKTLAKIAVYGGIASISAVMYMRSKLEERIINEEYFRLAVQTLRQHKGAVKLLGEPIKVMGFDLSDSKKNYCDGKNANFEVNIKGVNDKGKIFFWATNNVETGSWVLDRLEMELKSDPEKRYLLKKQQQNGAINEQTQNVDSSTVN